MKNILLFGLFTIAFLCSCHGPKKKEVESPKTSFAIDDSSIVFDTTSSMKDGIINIYADSINRARIVNQLPEFLKNRQFDYQMAGLQYIIPFL
ncbi:MAG: hypothetical protein Q8941_19110 [Bacteroidota bacterium]|nr:hypothetical protein [Bacteroidota bacterium]